MYFVPFAYYLITIYGCDHYNAISWISPSSSHSFTINNYLTGIRMKCLARLVFHASKFSSSNNHATWIPNSIQFQTPLTKTSSWRNSAAAMAVSVYSFIFYAIKQFSNKFILSHLVIKCNAKDHLKQLWFIVLSPHLTSNIVRLDIRWLCVAFTCLYLKNVS